MPPRNLKRRASTTTLPDATTAKKFRCEPCDQGYTTNRAYRRHLRESEVHSSAARKPHACSVCAERFVRPSGLARHVREQHEDGKRPCPRCGKAIRPNAAHKRSDRQPCVEARAIQSQPTECPPVSQQALIRDGNPQGWDANLPYLPDVPQAIAKKEVRGKRSRPPPCGICHRRFETYSESALSEHLRTHFEDLSKAKHSCEICKIGFVHAKDLESHMHNARNGNCGFKIEHLQPCTGHHAPPADASYHTLMQEWCVDEVSGKIEDKDRANFAITVQNWELAQLQLYMRTVDSVATVELPEAFCWSAHSAATRTRSTSSIMDTTRSVGSGRRRRPGRIDVALQADATSDASNDTETVTQPPAPAEAQDALRDAIQADDAPLARKALEAGASLDHVYDDDLTPLLLALRVLAYEAFVLMANFYHGTHVTFGMTIGSCDCADAHVPEFETSCTRCLVYEFLVRLCNDGRHPHIVIYVFQAYGWLITDKEAFLGFALVEACRTGEMVLIPRLLAWLMGACSGAKRGFQHDVLSLACEAAVDAHNDGITSMVVQYCIVHNMCLTLKPVKQALLAERSA